MAYFPTSVGFLWSTGLHPRSSQNFPKTSASWQVRRARQEEVTTPEGPGWQSTASGRVGHGICFNGGRSSHTMKLEGIVPRLPENELPETKKPETKSTVWDPLKISKWKEVISLHFQVLFLLVSGWGKVIISKYIFQDWNINVNSKDHQFFEYFQCGGSRPSTRWTFGCKKTHCIFLSPRWQVARYFRNKKHGNP